MTDRDEFWLPYPAQRERKLQSRKVADVLGLSERSSRRILAASEVWVLLRKRRRSIVHLLSLVLLIAQLGMQAHAYSHLKSDSDGVPGSPTQLCGQCASSAPLLTMASGSLCIRVPHVTHAEGIAPASIDSSVHRLPHPAFRSRAPPQLL
ncbi:MAG TPA: hypothetical protein VJT80_01110 [Steroidobacteraceae bacterium]|nr:hypothetical protein [Steroidobacteraceae bacterium]